MYNIKLPAFEGPFDLLLFLIRKHEVDIYDIPIARITREYLEYLELMKLLDLEIAGEFIEMVATLILIKTRMLLPGSEEQSGEEIEDPRRQLSLQLLEYRRYKEVAGGLETMQSAWQRHHARQTDAEKEFRDRSAEQEEEFVVDATLFELLAAFKRALDNMPRVVVHEVKMLKVTLEDQVMHIIRRSEGRKFFYFHEVVDGLPDKMHIIVTFMAILDLMKIGMLTVKQPDIFSEIRLVPLGEFTMSRYLALREDLEIDVKGESAAAAEAAG